MKNIFRKLIAMIGVGLFAMNSGFAQSFAVQSSTQLIPPYSVYLSDYATPGNEKLQVILVQRDLTQPSYQVRLVMVVELEGRVIMRTSRTFNPRPISLDPGIPTVISGADLAPYLDSRNIDFVGYSRDQYERTKALPEGQYNICFIAYDYRRQDVQVSNNGCSFYYLSKNEPPLTNFPVCGNRIMINTPQQVIFSWFPRNTASPNSAADTEYEFTLFETRPEGRNPNDVVLTTQPVFRTVTDFTQLVYGPGEPVLFEGMTYVWRVRAIDKNGKDAFRNNGYSEVCTFRYGGFDPQFDIGVVKNIQALGEADRRGKIWWETGEYEGYKVEYKKSGKDYRGDEYEWHYSNLPATQGEIKIYDLEPDTEYQARVTARKNNAFGPYSEIVKFRTRPPTIYQCGENNLPQITPANPIASASVGMVVNARGFDMTLVEIMPLNQPGYYKGIGFINNKFFGGARFYVKFDHLFIDENRNVAGPDRIDYVTEGVALMVQQQLADQKGRQLEQQQKENREQWADTEFSDKAFLYDEIVIEDVAVDESGNVIITEANGVTYTNTEIIPIINTTEKAVLIQDANGDQWVVQNKEGKTTATKVEGGGLVTGSDGKMIDEKTLSKLEKMILKALKKYLKEIEDYQASIKQAPEKSKGGGPSLFEWEIEMFLAELPVCLNEYKDQIGTIEQNLVKLTTEQTPFVSFVGRITQRVVEGDNASEEKVENVVCEAIVEGLNISFTKEQSALLLDQIREANQKKESQLDIVIYNGGKGTWTDYQINNQTFEFLSVKAAVLPFNVTPRTMIISPSELYKDDLSSWDSYSDTFVKFTFHENGLSDRSGPMTQVGKILFEIVVKKTDEVKLENYLFNRDIPIQLYEGENILPDGSITYITTEPRMPNIRARCVLEGGSVEMKLVIVDSLRKNYNGNPNFLVRADVTYYPGENTWQTVQAGETWTINFGTNFRGGKAFMIYRIGQSTDTITFHIRGRNPTQADVQAFLQGLPGGNSWYFVKLMRQESGTVTAGTDFRQFNPMGNEGPNNNDVRGRPTWGPPYGWGIMQLDNLGTTFGTLTAFNNRHGASANELWNWQENIRKGVQFFNGAKLAVANNRWTGALNDIEDWEDIHPNYVQQAYPMVIVQSLITAEVNTTVNSMIVGNNNNSEIFVSDPTPNNNDRAVRDAFALKFYNGGDNYFAIIIPPAPPPGVVPSLPYWNIDKTQLNGGVQRDYVTEVCGRPTW